MKSYVLLIAVSALLPSGLFAQGLKGTTRPPVFTPTFNAKNFPQSININNHYFPLLSGTTYVYEAMQGPREHDEFVVTHDIKEVLGVDCVVVRDTASINSQVIEDTFDYFRAGQVRERLVYGRRYQTVQERRNDGDSRDMAGLSGWRNA